MHHNPPFPHAYIHMLSNSFCCFGFKLTDRFVYVDIISGLHMRELLDTDIKLPAVRRSASILATYMYIKRIHIKLVQNSTDVRRHIDVLMQIPLVGSYLTEYSDVTVLTTKTSGIM